MIATHSETPPAAMPPPSLAAGLVVAASAALGTWFWLAGPASFLKALLVMAIVLGLQRSAFLHRQPLARAFVIEAALAGGALCAAFLLYDGSTFGTVLAMWSFWLIQAGYALVPRASREPGRGVSVSADDRRSDPFDRAHDAALAILNHRP